MADDGHRCCHCWDLHDAVSNDRDDTPVSARRVRRGYRRHHSIAHCTVHDYLPFCNSVLLDTDTEPARYYIVDTVVDVVVEYSSRVLGSFLPCSTTTTTNRMRFLAATTDVANIDPVRS